MKLRSDFTRRMVKVLLAILLEIVSAKAFQSLDFQSFNLTSLLLIKSVSDQPSPRANEAGNTCKPGSKVTSIRYSDTIVNYTIVGPVLSNITAKNERECEMECHLAVPIDMCYMFNYYPSSKVCELLYKDRAAEYKVEKKNGSTFRTRKCISNPCLPGHTCFSLGDQNKNSCLFVKGWLKVGSAVCIGAKDDQYGSVTIPVACNVSNFKLVYVSGGGISLATGNAKAYWGTTILGDPKDLNLFITDDRKNRVSPPPDFPIHRYYDVWIYELPGVTNMDPELTFPELSPPLAVTAGQVFRIWVDEDLYDGDVKDNSGQTCADVWIKKY